eukprot:scaffold55166_cov30-Tisochrysis_lutea.AAC.4
MSVASGSAMRRTASENTPQAEITYQRTGRVRFVKHAIPGGVRARRSRPACSSNRRSISACLLAPR